MKVMLLIFFVNKIKEKKKQDCYGASFVSIITSPPLI